MILENIVTSLKTENNTVVISNIVLRGDSKKKKRRKQLTNSWSASTNKKIPLVDHGNINRKRNLSQSKLHLNAHGKSVFVKNLRNL